MLSLSGISPAPGEKLVSVDSPIEFTIVDDGTGIDISTLIVEISGERAVNGTDFKDGFDGPLSSITPSGDNFIVVVDPESDFSIGQVVGVKIQVQSLEGKYLNETYSFKTVPEEPILVSASPDSKDILTSPQVLFFEFEDIIDGIDPTSITISINGLNYITNGVADPELNDFLTEVKIESTSAIVRIDLIEQLRNGDYTLGYEVRDTLGNPLISSFTFTVNLPEAILPPNFPQTGFLGFFQGVKRVSDVGCGDALLIEWNDPIKKNYKNEAFVLVYENEFRLNVFDNPTYLAIPDVEQATVTGLTAGKTLSYGARALELAVNVLDPNGMEIVDEGFFRLPDPVMLIDSMDVSDLVIRVNSVDGYPDAGLIIIGHEVMRYTAVDRINNTFSIPTNGRELFNTTASVYLSGDSVDLFLNCTDSNTVIIMATPTFQDGYGLDRIINGEGLVVTDYTDNDMKFFQGFDFCGYHDPLPQQTLTGEGNKDCGSYLGGEFNGFRGFNLYDRMLNREEVLLDQTGEPIILLKRIWDTETCSCMDHRKLSPKMKSCQECYGTGYVGGYSQFMNLRREDRRIMVKFDEAPEDLFHGEKEHLQQDFKPTAWTIPIPSIRDRDLLIRFDFTNDLEFIYEVQDVSREKILYRNFGRQKLTLMRLDKSDIVHTFPLDLNSIPL